jgi:alkylation response protein AidB-like acyl-CoA dehydrogenase
MVPLGFARPPPHGPPLIGEGRYGYMMEFRSAGRSRTPGSQIYGGTNQVMTMIIGRDLTGLR